MASNILRAPAALVATDGWRFGRCAAPYKTTVAERSNRRGRTGILAWNKCTVVSSAGYVYHSMYPRGNLTAGTCNAPCAGSFPATLIATPPEAYHQYYHPFIIRPRCPIKSPIHYGGLPWRQLEAESESPFWRRTLASFPCFLRRNGDGRK